jgi:acyl transferase domain-containing protein
VSHETAGLKEKVRTIDDEFSKRVKAIESVLQREAVKHAQKHSQIEEELKGTLASLKEIALHTEQ